MVHHVILWTLNPELTPEKKAEVLNDIKTGLEALKSVVDGVVDVNVVIGKRLESSNCDLMLDSSFVSEEALKGYASHPEHLKVANEKVRPYTIQRVCLDYETE